jgi:hemolysin III
MSQLTSGNSYRDVLYQRLIAVRSRVARRSAVQPGVLFEYPPFQSASEERANGLIHGTAALASLAGAAWLMIAAMRLADPLLTIGCAAYAASLIGVFTMSTLSHVIEPPRLRHLFRALDQACIYLLTAGSCTPYFIRFLSPHGWGWMLPAVWCIALFGVWIKLRGHRVNSVSVLFNVALGWFPGLAIWPLWTYMPVGCFVLIVLAAAFYMLGVVFLCYDERCRFFHAVWHVLVVAASACVYAGIAMYVV